MSDEDLLRGTLESVVQNKVSSGEGESNIAGELLGLCFDGISKSR